MPKSHTVSQVLIDTSKKPQHPGPSFVRMQEKRARAQALYKQRDELQARAGHAWDMGDRVMAQRLLDESRTVAAEARVANNLAAKEIHNHKCALS